MRPRRRFSRRLRAWLLAGLLVTAPAFITIYATWWFITFVDAEVSALLPTQYDPALLMERYLSVRVPGIGLIIVLIALIVIGAVATKPLGRFFVKVGERTLNRMPVVNTLYNALKQIFETVMAQQSDAFRQAVLVEYPRKGVWSIGFVTGTTKGEVQRLTDVEVVNVFLPTTPNPTSGYLLFVPADEVIPLRMPVDAAIKLVISGGLVVPPEEPSPGAEAQNGRVPLEKIEQNP